jgi:HAD superfamily hydrolase (TIGR01549 family)
MALIFDLDGTLVDSVPLHLKAMRAAMKNAFGENAIPDLFIRDTIRYPLSMVFKLAKKKYKHVDFSVEAQRKIMRDKANFFNMKNLCALKLFPGVNRMPKLLKRLDIRFCIVTSMSSNELMKFDQALKLDRISELIINPPSIRYEKPNPYTLEEAVKAMRADKKKTFYVGDSPYDAVASRRAGIGFIGIHNRKELSSKGEFYVGFPALLKEILKDPSRFRD